MKKERLMGPDIVRTFAILFVVLLHSTEIFGVSGMFFNSVGGYFSLFARCFAITCVPLFLLLTGYLQCNKKLSKSFYKGIIPVLTGYVFISVVTLLYLPEHHELYRPTFFDGVKGILDFTANPYSWYVEMYIGLFLLIPFLNLIYNNLNSKKHKLVLIGTLVFITGITDFIISLSKEQSNAFITLDYWKNFYPISYYFIGCYIREYQPKINKKLHFAALSIIPALISRGIFYGFKGSYLHSWTLSGWTNITIVFLSVSFFLFFYDIDIKNKFMRNILSDISQRSFDMYLFSFILDDMAMRFFVEKGVAIEQWYIFIGLPLIFLSAYLLAKGKQLLFFLVRIYKVKFKK